jgi:hypothetical protein
MAVSGIVKSAVYPSESLTMGIQQSGSQTVWQHEFISLFTDIRIVCHEMMITQLFYRFIKMQFVFLAIIKTPKKKKKTNAFMRFLIK